MATTTKSKTPSRKAKDPVSGNTTAKSKQEVLTNRPTEEQIRRKAQEIYYQRLSRGEYGTELDDWQKAEQLLSQDL